LYSLQITGGAVVFMIGWTAVREGIFSVGGSNVRQTLFDVSIVPLATPLIAGPGMLAATITMSAETGLPVMLAALASAIAINFVLMVFSWRINRLLKKLHMTGPLIRFAGLITAAIAVQMMISGFKAAFP
ncbi:MAG: hypothetical protein MJ025_05565, partial [Victivallaceae bacterium]|nr:hypothetical protein [Victivallaceae bacterium]